MTADAAEQRLWIWLYNDSGSTFSSSDRVHGVFDDEGLAAEKAALAERGFTSVGYGEDEIRPIVLNRVTR